MADEFQQSLPSIRQVQNLISDKTRIGLKVSTGDFLTGRLVWQDANCLSIQEEGAAPFIVWKQAIVFIQPNP
jgi:host factor-I protein